MKPSYLPRENLIFTPDIQVIEQLASVQSVSLHVGNPVHANCELRSQPLGRNLPANETMRPDSILDRVTDIHKEFFYSPGALLLTAAWIRWVTTGGTELLPRVAPSCLYSRPYFVPNS